MKFVLYEVCNAFGISLAMFFAEGELVEVNSDVKKLYESWVALTKDEQDSIRAIAKSYMAKK